MFAASNAVTPFGSVLPRSNRVAAWTLAMLLLLVAEKTSHRFGEINLRTALFKAESSEVLLKLSDFENGDLGARRRVRPKEDKPTIGEGGRGGSPSLGGGFLGGG